MALESVIAKGARLARKVKVSGEPTVVNLKRGHESYIGDVIPGRPNPSASLDMENFTSEASRRVLNPESFSPSYSGVSPINPAAGDAGSVFSEASRGWKRAASIFGNGVVENFGSNTFKKIAGSSLGFGIAGGMTGGIASMLAPNNFEYQGTVAPIFKGVMTGAVLGAMHGGAGKMMTKYSGNEFVQNWGKMTQRVTDSKLTTGAIAAGVWAGTTDTHFTRPINGGR